jgi:pilus assembly protein CpaC
MAHSKDRFGFLVSGFRFQNGSPIRNRLWFLFLVLAGVVLPLNAADGQEAKGKEIPNINLTSGRAQLMDVPFPVRRVSVGNPNTADVIILSPRQLYILGKATGVTNLLIQGEDQRQTILDILVEPDVTQLKEKLHQLLPGESVEVYPGKDGILLKGEVSNASVLASVLSIAEPFAPGKVVNLLQVGGLQQVLLEVKVAEVSRSALNRLGVNLASVVRDGFFGFTNLGGSVPITSFTTTLPDLTLSDVQVNISPNNNLFLGSPRNHVIGFLDALKQDGLVKILAEPSLIAVNGQTANFLAGGEFPIPVPQAGAASGAITVQFKRFGVQLWFTPTILNSEKISLKVSPEVSDVDFSTAVQIGGFVVPGVTTRGATTTVELMDGHTFAIAGLIREDARNLISKFPILGDIPILGLLFRSTSFQKSETELLILVTPHLAKSLGPPEKIALPTDLYRYYEREMLGFPFRGKRPATPPGSLRGGLEGEFGHSN